MNKTSQNPLKKWLNSLPTLLFILLLISVFIFFILFDGLNKTRQWIAQHNPTPKIEGHGHEDHDDHDDHDDHEDHEDEKKNHASSKMVEISLASAQQAGVEIQEAQAQTLQIVVETVGEITLNPEQVVHVVSRSPGIVQSVQKKIGDTVQINELLAILESAELVKAKMEYLQSQKELEICEYELKRAETIYKNTTELFSILKKKSSLPEIQQRLEGLDLGDHGAEFVSAYVESSQAEERYHREQQLYKDKISKYEDFLREEQLYKKAKSSYFTQYNRHYFETQQALVHKQQKQALAILALQKASNYLSILGITSDTLKDLSNQASLYENFSKIELRAPITGTIIEKHLTQGEILKEDTVPFIIANLQTVWLQLNIYQKDLQRVQKNQTVKIQSENNQTQAEGTISHLSATIKEDTRTSAAYIVLKNEDGRWKPGMFIAAQIVLEKLEVPVAVSAEAIQTIDNKTVVFVQEGETFEVRRVKTGKSDSNWVEILVGLNAEERYVSKNSFLLKAELGKGEAEHQH